TALVDGQLRTLVPSKPPTWKPGYVSAQAFQGRADTVVEVDEAGDFEKDEAFSCGAWVRLDKNRLTGAVVARMDDRAGFRGWDLWVDNGRFGTQIINKWPDDAIKVVTQDTVKAGDWNHVCVTYDGSGKAEGVKIYLNGVLQERRLVTQNGLRNSIRTAVP